MPTFVVTPFTKLTCPSNQFCGSFKVPANPYDVENMFDIVFQGQDAPGTTGPWTVESFPDIVLQGQSGPASSAPWTIET